MVSQHACNEQFEFIYKPLYIFCSKLNNDAYMAYTNSKQSHTGLRKQWVFKKHYYSDKLICEKTIV